MIPILCCSRRKFWCCPFVSVDLASGAGKPEKFGLLWTVFVRSEQFLTNENSRGHPKSVREVVPRRIRVQVHFICMHRILYHRHNYGTLGLSQHGIIYTFDNAGEYLVDPVLLFD